MPLISHDESASSDSAFMSSDSYDTTDPTTLDTLNESPPPSKRRKISSKEGTFVSSPFTIRPPSASPAGKELALTPIALLPRCHLPLSWLDPFAGSTDGLPGLLFSANIPSLEEDLGRHVEPVVMAVRSNDSGDAYAVERVKKGIYALCGLGGWVSDTDILLASKRWLESPAIARRDMESVTEECDEMDWRRAAEVPGYDLDMGTMEIQPDLDISMAFGPHNQTLDPGEVAMIDGDIPDTEDRQGSFNPSNGATGGPGTEPPMPGEQIEGAEPTLSEVFERLRTQYLEALYVSKTSVGYFAKGPLSRSRTALQQILDKESSELPNVSKIYRDGILPMKKMDVKYRETLPDVIKALPPALADDEPAAHSKPSKKKKGKNKNKVGRNGLYPEEEPLVGSWWRNRQPTETSLPIGSSKEEQIKQYVSDLRLREMQLQVLWILETISMEATIQGDPKNTGLIDSSDPSNVKKSKTKKPQDLNVLLELLLDRLCIWHTVSFEESLLADGVKSQGKNGSTGAKVESDKLRDFCTEVIIPFYASRLPDQCKVINRKLGGPTAISPVRQKRPQSRRASQVQPGAAVQRTKPLNPRRALQRVLTDEKATLRGNAPSLMRSNTAPTAPEIKREPSEPPSLHASFRGGIQNSKRLDNREVDLNSTAKQHEAKLKRMNKLMEQKKELDTAINQLRKPNRELVAREFAESAEQRSVSRSRKPKNPVRNPLGQGVQVMATPRANRKKNVTGGLPSQTKSQSSLSVEQFQSPVHNMDVHVVPSSNIRRGYRDGNFSGEVSTPNFPRGAQSQPAEISRVDGTPSRRFSKSSSALGAMTHEESGLPKPSRTTGNLFKVPELPSRSTSDTLYSTPTKSRRKTLQPVLRRDGDPVSIEETPPKPMAAASMESSRVPASPSRMARQPMAQTTPLKRTSAPQEDAQLVPDSVPRPSRSSIETPPHQKRAPNTSKNVSPSAVKTSYQPGSPSPGKADGQLYRSLGWEDDEEDELCMF